MVTAARIQSNINDRDKNKNISLIFDNNSAGRVFPKDAFSDLGNNNLRSFGKCFWQTFIRNNSRTK